MIIINGKVHRCIHYNYSVGNAWIFSPSKVSGSWKSCISFLLHLQYFNKPFTMKGNNNNIVYTRQEDG